MGQYIKKYEAKKSGNEAEGNATEAQGNATDAEELPACRDEKIWCESDKFRGRANHACKKKRVKRHCALTCAQMMPMRPHNCKLPNTDEDATTEGATPANV